MVEITTNNAFTRAIAARYVVAILGSIAMGIVYGLKVNLSVALVSMVNNTALMETPLSTINKLPTLTNATTNKGCPEELNNQTQLEDGPFPWPTTVQGALKSAYFWGYLVAQIPGGRIAELFSAKWVMFFAVMINVIGTLLSPIAAKGHYGILLVMRIAEGIGGGVTFPAMHVMLAKWAPPSERSTMSSIVYAGTALGTVVFTLITGLIAAGWGWEAIFYIEGFICIIWLILWVLLIADNPTEQTLISEDERKFITASLHTDNLNSNKKPSVPWKAVFTSPPFLAILIAHTCANWGWYIVLIELPNYMKNVLKFKITENAILSSLPFFTMWLFSMVLSKILDSLQNRLVINTTTARKTATLIASVIPLICFVLLSYIGCMRFLAIVLVTISVTAIGGMFSGFLSNHIDIAPNFAGTLVAITNSFATIPGIIVPIFVGKLTEADPTISSWRIIFWVTVVLYMIEIIVYTIFASGEEQKWNRCDTDESGETQPLKPKASN